MSYTIGDLKNGVRYLVGDKDGRAFNDTMLCDAINWAQNHLCRIKLFTRTETTVSNTVAPFRKYAVPAGWLHLIEVLDTSSNPLDKTTEDFEDRKGNTAWRTTTGTPKRWYWYDGSNVALEPVPSASYSVTMVYVDTPSPQFTITNGSFTQADTVTLDARIPAYYLPFLKYAAAAWLLQLDGDEQDIQKADKYLATFLQLAERGPNSMRTPEPLMGGQ